MSGIQKPLRCLLLALGLDDLRPAHPFRLRLPSDHPDHPLVNIDMLQLDVADLYTPGIRSLVEDTLQVRVELVPLCKHGVEIMPAQDGAQRI